MRVKMGKPFQTIQTALGAIIIISGIAVMAYLMAVPAYFTWGSFFTGAGTALIGAIAICAARIGGATRRGGE